MMDTSNGRPKSSNHETKAEASISPVLRAESCDWDLLDGANPGIFPMRRSIGRAGINDPPDIPLPTVEDIHRIPSAKGWMQNALLSEQNRLALANTF